MSDWDIDGVVKMQKMKKRNDYKNVNKKEKEQE